MQYVNAIIAVVLLGLALTGRDDPVQAGMFILAATLAAIAFKHWLSRRIVKVLAIVAAGLLFWHFAQFLYLVPHLSQTGIGAATAFAPPGYCSPASP